jgi:3-dehydroquinate synthase
VAIGMVLAFELSARLGHCPAADAGRVAAHLAAVGLPTRAPRTGPRGAVTAAALMSHMSQDKKMKDGAMTFVLARRIGDAFLSRDVPAPALEATLTAALAG